MNCYANGKMNMLSASARKEAGQVGGHLISVYFIYTNANSSCPRCYIFLYLFVFTDTIDDRLQEECIQLSSGITEFIQMAIKF